jgi:hypothetical protein
MQFSMRKLAAGFVLVVASFTTAFTVGTVTASPASASVAASSHSKLWWDRETCGDYLAWDRKPDAERFRRMASAARHADVLLAQDVAVWVQDTAGKQGRVVLEADRGEVFADCVTVLYGI